MSWTDWRFLANGDSWSSETFDWKGASVYELAIGGPRGGNLQTMYVGETKEESVRLATYGSGRSHIEDYLSDALAEGWTIFYRAMGMPSKEQAKATQDSLLSKFDYPWNTLGQ